MKRMLDILDERLARAKRHARKTRWPLRTLVEDGLRRMLPSPAPRPRYILSDLTAGDLGALDLLEQHSRREFRELMFGVPGTR